MPIETNEEHQASGKKSKNQKLIELAAEIATSIRGTDGRNYVVLKDKPHIAIPHSGTNSKAVLTICNQFHVATTDWVGTNGMNHLASYLTAQCGLSEPVEVHMRAGSANGNIYLDYGNPEHQILQITGTGTKLVDESPIFFTRGAVISPFPELSQSTISLTELRRFIRVDEKALPALVGCIIGMWMSNIPQPIVFLHGSAGSGKTTSLRFILDLVDPTTKMPGGALTENVRDLKSLAALRRVMVFDNASHVKGEASDHLARIATGGEMTLRSLYENDLPHITMLMRPIVINGIMDGFTRGDLASRAISFELSTIPKEDKEAFSDLEMEWELLKPQFFAAILEIASSMIANKAQFFQQVSSNHRNIDLMRVIGFVSQKLGIDGLAYIEESIESLSRVVLGGNVVTEALRATVDCAVTNVSGCPHYFESFDSNFNGSTILNDYFDLKKLKGILESHIPVDDRKALPQTPKQLGESLKRVESEIELLFGVRLNKKTTNKGVRYSFSLVSANECV